MSARGLLARVCADCKKLSGARRRAARQGGLTASSSTAWSRPESLKKKSWRFLQGRPRRQRQRSRPGDRRNDHRADESHGHCRAPDRAGSQTHSQAASTKIPNNSPPDPDMAITIYLSLIFLALYLVGLAMHRWIFWRDKKRMRAESREGGRVVAQVDELRAGLGEEILADLPKIPGRRLAGQRSRQLSRLRQPLPPYADAARLYARSVLSARTDDICSVTLTGRSMSSAPAHVSPDRAKANRCTVCRCGWIGARSWSAARKAI